MMAVQTDILASVFGDVGEYQPPAHLRKFYRDIIEGPPIVWPERRISHHVSGGSNRREEEPEPVSDDPGFHGVCHAPFDFAAYDAHVDYCHQYERDADRIKAQELSPARKHSYRTQQEVVHNDTIYVFAWRYDKHEKRYIKKLIGKKPLGRPR